MTIVTLIVWELVPFDSRPVVEMEIVPVQVAAPIAAWKHLHREGGGDGRELPAGRRHLQPSLTAIAGATRTHCRMPLPLMVTCCAGGAAPPGVATLNVSEPVPVPAVALIVRLTFNVAVRPSLV